MGSWGGGEEGRVEGRMGSVTKENILLSIGGRSFDEQIHRLAELDSHPRSRMNRTIARKLTGLPGPTRIKKKKSEDNGDQNMKIKSRTHTHTHTHENAHGHSHALFATPAGWTYFATRAHARWLGLYRHDYHHTITNPACYLVSKTENRNQIQKR